MYSLRRQATHMYKLPCRCFRLISIIVIHIPITCLLLWSHVKHYVVSLKFHLFSSLSRNKPTETVTSSHGPSRQTWETSGVAFLFRSPSSPSRRQSSSYCTDYVGCSSRSSSTRVGTRSGPWSCGHGRRLAGSSTQTRSVECLSWTATCARTSRSWNSTQHLVKVKMP